MLQSSCRKQSISVIDDVLVEVPQIVTVEKSVEIVDVPVQKQRQVPMMQKVQKFVHVPQVQHIDKIVDVPVQKQRQVPEIQIVQKVAEVPQVQFIDKVVDVPVVKNVEVPFQQVQKMVKVHVIETYEKVMTFLSKFLKS